MGYCTTGDVALALEPSAGVPAGTTAASLPDDQLQDAVDEASATVYSYVHDRYPITLNQDGIATAQVIRFVTRNIAAYLATLTWRRGKDFTEDDPVRLRYIHTMSLLERVQNGTAALPIELEGGGTVDEPEAYNLYEGHLFGPHSFGVSAEYGERSHRYRLGGTLF